MRDLEAALRELGREVAFPEPPDVVPAVRARLAAPARVRPWWRRRALALSLAATAALALAAALAVPPARTALLRLLGVEGVSVERVETLPETHPNARLVPGRPVPFSEAQRAVSFRVLAPPTKGGCRRCGTVWLDRSIPGGRVTIVWPGERPRLFLMQFRGQTLPFVQKSIGPGTTARAVDVGGVPGYWLAGARHAVVFRDARGEMLFGRRLASNVLLWERGGVTYRLEGDIGLRRAVAVAGDLE